MLNFFRHPGVGFTLLCLLASFLLASSALVGQETSGGTELHAGVPTLPASFSDFEVKIGHGKFLMRQKGSRKWRSSGEVKEPIAVGLLDGSRKIYLPTGAIELPKPKRHDDPDFPHSSGLTSGMGAVSMHVVIDENGTVRLPTVDTSSGVEYTKATAEAVQKWTFEPAKLNGQPVAVLLVIETTFRTMR